MDVLTQGVGNCNLVRPEDIECPTCGVGSFELCINLVTSEELDKWTPHYARRNEAHEMSKIVRELAAAARLARNGQFQVS